MLGLLLVTVCCAQAALVGRCWRVAPRHRKQCKATPSDSNSQQSQASHQIHSHLCPIVATRAYLLLKLASSLSCQAAAARCWPTASAVQAKALCGNWPPCLGGAAQQGRCPPRTRLPWRSSRATSTSAPPRRRSQKTRCWRTLLQLPLPMALVAGHPLAWTRQSTPRPCWADAWTESRSWRLLESPSSLSTLQRLGSMPPRA